MEPRLEGAWLLMVDGAARGNPGPAGCGAVVLDETGAVLKELSRCLGIATNNVAEYQGLLLGLETVLKLGGKRLCVQSDSELLVRQLNGIYRVKNENLKVLHRKALALLQRLEAYRIIHVRREQNRRADQLANEGIDCAAEDDQRLGGSKTPSS
jgi:ribonuclease HI